MATNHLPITPDLSKQARRERGLSQNDVIKATGIPAYKIKQFEGRHMPIDVVDQRKLREFYEAQGIDLDELQAHLDQVSNPAPGAAGARASNASSNRPGFFISADLPPDVVDRLLSDMEDSDNRIAELVKTSVKNGLMGDMTDKTESDVRELFGHLAANHLRFRCLQGRNIIAPTRDEAKTVGDHLSQWAQEKSLACVVPGTDGKGAIAKPDAQTDEQE